MKRLQIAVSLFSILIVSSSQLMAQCSECGEQEASCCDVDSVFGTCCTQPMLLGEMHGLRPALQQHGLMYNASLTQFYQGVTSGGIDERWESGGKFDQNVIFSGAPYGNSGFIASMHVESRYGNDINTAGGTASPPNIAMLYPKVGEQETAITGLFAQQMLSDNIAIVGGKFQSVDLIDMLVHSGRGVEGFMNTSLTLLPMTVARTTNLSFLGAGVLSMEGQEIEGGFILYDTNDNTTTSGFDKLFDNGVVMMGFWRFFTEFNNKPGYQLFGANYSTGDYRTTDPSGFSFIPGVGVVAEEVNGTWSAFYAMNQQLWGDRCNPARKLDFIARLGVADEDPNFIQFAASAAIEGHGVISSRENDRFGAGYFYENFSGKFTDLVSPAIPLQDLHGMELYYNAAITPWFHLTGDLQVIRGANANLDTAVIPGLRAQLIF